MTRAWGLMRGCIQMVCRRRIIPRWTYWPRPGYCWRCGAWCWLTREPAPASTAYGWLCEPCAEENMIDVNAAWASYYGGLGV